MRLVVPILTKFDEGGELVLDDGYANFVEKLVESGVDVLMPCGTNSEFHVMTIDERKKVFEFFLENFSKRIEIMPHVGSASFKETVELSDFAFSRGAEVVSVVAPYYFRYDPKSLVEYYVDLAKTFPDGKFVLYNIPSFTGNRLTFEMIKEIKYRAPNVVGMKDTDNRPWIVGKLKKEFGGFVVYGGLDTTVIDYLARGADGHVSGTANVFPKLLRSILDSFENREYERAFELQKVLDEIVENVSGHVAFIGANKYALRLLGYDLGRPRRPNRELDGDEKKSLEEFLERVREWSI